MMTKPLSKLLLLSLFTLTSSSAFASVACKAIGPDANSPTGVMIERLDANSTVLAQHPHDFGTKSDAARKALAKCNDLTQKWSCETTQVDVTIMVRGQTPYRTGSREGVILKMDGITSTIGKMSNLAEEMAYCENMIVDGAAKLVDSFKK